MDSLDFVIVGGGIQGASVAEAAAAAGYSVLLLEKDHPAHGTSSRSSKLIHGGLRYLETGQLRLVSECLSERTILLRRAPELVRLQPFRIPLYAHSRRRPWQIAVGLGLYGALARFGTGSGFARIRRERWPQLDGLDADGLRQVYQYSDGQTDDAALTAAVIGSATRLGARALFPAEFLGARREGDQWRLAYTADGREHSLRCRRLVNAGGPWVNQVLARIEQAPAPLAVEWVQGTHLLIEGSLQASYYVEASDGRAVFIMPWRERILVGTTELVFAGEPDQVAPTDAEVDYLLATFRRYFPARPARVERAFAGLRVLPRGDDLPFSRPRETQLLVDEPAQPRLLSIYGGKLTAARATAERAVRMLEPGLPPRHRQGDTRSLPLIPV